MTPTLARRTGALTIIAAAATALAGCGGVGARLTFDDTVKAKVTRIVMAGGSGDVIVKTAPVGETQIRRIVHRSSDPGESYRLDGDVLHIDTDCGRSCSVSYEITAPAGVVVQGALTSGDLSLTGIDSADVTLTSGNVTVRDAAGAVRVKSTSGDVDVLGAKGATVESSSGNVRAMNVGGAVTVKATSGDVDVKLTVAAPVTARTGSGNVDVIVPPGSYQVRTDTGSGDATVTGVTNDPSSRNVLDVHTGSGDVSVVAAA
jgi:Putative adhesin